MSGGTLDAVKHWRLGMHSCMAAEAAYQHRLAASMHGFCGFISAYKRSGNVSSSRAQAGLKWRKAHHGLPLIAREMAYRGVTFHRRVVAAMSKWPEEEA